MGFRRSRLAVRRGMGGSSCGILDMHRLRYVLTKGALMNPTEIILTVILAAAVIAVIAALVIRKRKGRSSCSCGCEGCP